MFKTLLLTMIAAFALMACGPDQTTLHPTPPVGVVYPDTAADIGTYTLLDGYVLGTMHGQELDGAVTQMSGISNTYQTRVDLIVANEDVGAHMARLQLASSLDDFVSYGEYATLSQDDYVRPTVGCSGPQPYLWDLDSRATEVVMHGYPEDNEVRRIDYVLNLGVNGRVEGHFRYIRN